MLLLLVCSKITFGKHCFSSHPFKQGEVSKNMIVKYVKTDLYYYTRWSRFFSLSPLYSDSEVNFSSTLFYLFILFLLDNVYMKQVWVKSLRHRLFEWVWRLSLLAKLASKYYLASGIFVSWLKKNHDIILKFNSSTKLEHLLRSYHTPWASRFAI